MTAFVSCTTLRRQGDHVINCVEAIVHPIGACAPLLAVCGAFRGEVVLRVLHIVTVRARTLDEHRQRAETAGVTEPSSGILETRRGDGPRLQRAERRDPGEQRPRRDHAAGCVSAALTTCEAGTRAAGVVRVAGIATGATEGAESVNTSVVGVTYVARAIVVAVTSGMATSTAPVELVVRSPRDCSGCV